MVRNEAEIENDIIGFIKGWGYCRKLPDTEINTKGLVKKVKFGASVYGRELEYFHYYKENTLPLEFINIDGPHWVTLFAHTEKVVENMKSLGYNLRANEYLMKVCPLKNMGQYKNHVVEKVHTKKQSEEINNYLGFEKFNPDRIDDPNIHYYFIRADNKPVCTGVISTIEGSSCLDRIHTDENYRGLGLAASLCSFMLDSCQDHGVTRNILGSSEMGLHLYKKLGYETVIPMYVFEKN